MSDSALRMVLDDLKELYRAKEITFPQYQAELAAIRKEAREAESSSSPKRESDISLGVVESEVVGKIGSEGTSADDEKAFLDAFVPPLPVPKAQVSRKMSRGKMHLVPLGPYGTRLEQLEV